MHQLNPNRRNAFTLIELLVVISIIAILVSLTLAAGSKVVSVGRASGTTRALQTLDMSVEEYVQANGSIPPATVKDPLDTSKKPKRVPIVDGIVNDQSSVPTGLRFMDSTAWYVHQLQAEGSSALAAIQQIDPQLRRVGIVKQADARSDSTQTGTRTTRILDVWGNPIHYVHPRFGGIHTGPSAGSLEDTIDVLGGVADDYKFTSLLRDAKSRWIPTVGNDGTWRFTADSKEVELATARGASDGGGTSNRRPYFYSAGPDGDPSTIEDNVYTIRPNFPR